MHGIDSRALDAYIMGTNIHYDDLVDHECRFCGEKWQAPMFYELGGWFYNNDDQAYCPKCEMEFHGGEYYHQLECLACHNHKRYEGESLLNHLWFFHGKRVNTGINDLFDKSVKEYYARGK